MEPSPTRMQKMYREGCHALLMFIMIVPFYLYGGNILSGNHLYEDPVLVDLFITKVVTSVILTELLFNWVPYYILRLASWRIRYTSILVSGLMFGLMVYWVLPPIHFEGEAVYGMLIVWVISEVIVNSLFKKIQWYHIPS